MEFSRTLKVWERSKAKKASSNFSFRPAFLLPPEELPIQGLMTPEPRRKRPKTSRARRGRLNVEAERKTRKFNGGIRGKALKGEGRITRFLCGCCDYSDKQTGRCLILRLGGECPYMNGVYSRIKKPMEIPVRR